jgi:hypothetical protein
VTERRQRPDRQWHSILVGGLAGVVGVAAIDARSAPQGVDRAAEPPVVAMPDFDGQFVEPARPVVLIGERTRIGLGGVTGQTRRRSRSPATATLTTSSAIDWL